MRPTSSRAGARSATLAVAACALALGLAACSSSNKTTSTAGTSTSSSNPPTSAPSGSTTTSTAGTAAVQVAQTNLGKVLVDKTGLTLYLLTKDSPTASTCTDGCAQAWPPLTVAGTPAAGAGVTGTLTTIKRADGTSQVVINGHPLYTFAGDSKPGDTNGQNVEKIWFAVTPQGNPVAASAS